MELGNKWIRGAIPSLLIHCSIGTVYCWSLLKNDIAHLMGTDASSIELAFSLAIFFLGMSAAFGGRYVEKNVVYSSVISMACFSAGLMASVYAIMIKSIPLLFLSYGCLMGIGLGIGYISPIKTLMLWFYRNKGLATGIAISGFGLSKAIYSPFIVWCNDAYGVLMTISCMSLFSILCMGVASMIIRKPKDWTEDNNNITVKGIISVLSNKAYMKIWAIFYINITCGLAVISFEKDLAELSGIVCIGVLSAITAIFNTIGRFGYSTISDLVDNKAKIYMAIFATSSIALLLPISFGINVFLTAIALCIVNAGYGGGFSTLPTLLENKFGMTNISTIHGLTLSAWALAGLSGNQLSNIILNYFRGTFSELLFVLMLLYMVALVIAYTIDSRKIETTQNRKK